MNYEGNSKVLAGLTIIGFTVAKVVKYVVIGGVVVTLLWGPQVLPWYRKYAVPSGRR